MRKGEQCGVSKTNECFGLWVYTKNIFKVIFDYTTNGAKADLKDSVSMAIYINML